MKRLLLILGCALLGGVAMGRVSTREAPPSGEHREGSALRQHLETAMTQMDAGIQSAEYRESLEFLRAHPGEVAQELEGALLEEPGSFGKWQLTYLLGEVGNERAIQLLRDMLDRPIPAPASSRTNEHRIDLRHAEELNSRAQAVISTARIAVHRPELRDRVLASLLETAREVPMAAAVAQFELQKLLARDSDAFLPPPRWRARLSQRIAEEAREQQERRERRAPVCRLD